MPITSNTPSNIAIIGAGIMGRNHAAAIACDPRLKLVAIAGVPLESAENLAQEYSVAFVTDDYREILNRPDVDMVTVATPDHMHLEICQAAALAGKHFMVEKPLTTNLAEADILTKVVNDAGIVGMTSFNHRWIPTYARAYQEILAGNIGRPVMAYARKNDRIFVPTEMLSWASETTPSWFLSSHDIDLVTWFMGAKATEVYATAVWGVLRGKGVNTPDAIQAQVRFDGGQLATFEACWIYPNSYPSMTDSFIEVIGEEGMMHLKRDSDQIELATDKSFEYPRTSISLDLHGEQRGAVFECLHHFTTCVRESKSPLVTIESSRHVIAILDALHRSLDSGVAEKVL